MKSGMKKLTACLLAALLILSSTTAMMETYSSAVIVGKADGYREALEIVAEKGTYVLIGQTLQLGVNEDYDAVWRSDNENIAEVDGDGVVTAIAEGLATITAQDGDQRAAVIITVIDPAPLMQEAEAAAAAAAEEEAKAAEEAKAKEEAEIQPAEESEEKEEETEPAEEIQPEEETEPAEETEEESEQEAETESKPEEVKAEAKTEEKAEKKAEAKTEQKTEAKTEEKAEPKTEAKTEEKTEEKAEAKAEEKTETKPEAEAEPEEVEAEPETEDEAEEEAVTEPETEAEPEEEAEDEPETEDEPEEEAEDEPEAEDEFEDEDEFEEEGEAEEETENEPEEETEAEPEAEAESEAEPEKPVVVEKIAMVIVVNGLETREVYDGEEHTLADFAATSNRDPFDPEKVKVRNEIGVSATDCGMYELVLEASNFYYDDENVIATFVVNNGWMRITPAPVLVVADNKSKESGEADPELTATVTGLFGEDTIEYELYRMPGETIGEYIIEADGEAKQGNYKIQFEPGKLVITGDPVVMIESSVEPGQPIYAGTEITLKAVTIGFGDGPLSYQWQYSTDSKNWTDIEGATKKSYTYSISVENAAYRYRVCVNPAE